MKKISRFSSLAALLFIPAAATLLPGCKGKEQDTKTGWNYNDSKNGGFDVAEFQDQETGPGLVLVEGGRFTMGATEQNIGMEMDNIPRTVTVQSFYMDETEVSNLNYRMYTWWLYKTYGQDPTTLPIYKAALPDTLVWRRNLAYNEPYVEMYFRHPAYNNYPVVGVSWKQTQDYCIWRTDRVNETMLEREGFKNQTGQFDASNPFNTDAYLAGLVELDGKKKKGKDGQERNITMEDGILLPTYRLPTEAEWEFAALALVGNAAGENIEDRKVYPWSGRSMRDGRPGKTQGQILANFKRGRGDYMGIAGRLNDMAAPTAPVLSYYPNDYGLYNMAGNVNEWVQDLYRPLSFQDQEDFNSYRGNVFTIPAINADGQMEKDTAIGPNYNRLRRVADTVRMIDPYVLDDQDSIEMYNEKNTLVSNQSRVYKGGGWRDMPYWMSPGTRRFLNENNSADDIGFRCAMIRMGSPTGVAAKKKKK
jgi:formylglycine-generating enzyme